MNFLIKNFLRGLVIVVPIAVTGWVLIQTFLWIDTLFPASVPGLGFLTTVCAIVLIGLLASNILIRKLFVMTERLFIKAPFVKIVYSSIKDLIEAFVGEKRKFDRPVLVALDSSGGLKALGFITRDDLSFLSLQDYVAVYFPQSYNFAGNLVVVARTQVQPVAADSSQVMAFIVSGGISGFAGIEN